MSATVPDFFFDLEHLTLDRLDRILPLGQFRPLGDDIQLTLLSLECYQAGFVALTLFEQTHPPFPDVQSRSDDWQPPLLIRATPVLSAVQDDRGNRYAVRSRAGSGGSIGPERLGTRFVHCFAPALDPAALSLTFTVSLVAPLTYDEHEEPIANDSNTVGGPWPVSFALQRPMEATL